MSGALEGRVSVGDFGWRVFGFLSLHLHELNPVTAGGAGFRAVKAAWSRG